MKISTSIEKWIFAMVTYYHLIYMFLATFIHNMTNKIAILMLVLLWIYYNKHVANKNKFAFIAFNGVFVFYILYTVARFGISQVTHSDFYTFWLLFVGMLVYSDATVIEKFRTYLCRKRQPFFISIYIFFALIIYSILFQGGLHLGYGSRIPVLYGPYSVPHVLAYAFVGVYCGVSLIENKKNDTSILILKVLCVIGAVWTAARSGVLAIALAVFADFLKMRKISMKLLIVCLGGIIGLYLLLYTDILYNNPLIQKTLYALSEGSITNNRDKFAAILIDYYKNYTSFIDKIFGIGMNNVREILRSDSTVGVAIHAHNDYVNALCGYGIVGIIIFLIGQIKILKINASTLFIIIFELLIIVLSYFNGLAMYSSLTPALLVVYAFFSTNTQANIKVD